MSSKTNKLIGNFIVFILGSFGSKILVFLLLPLYTSVLSTAEYGTIDLITTTTMLLYPVVTLGLNDAIFRFVMSKSYSRQQIVRIGVRVPCIIYSVTLVIAIFLNFFIQWPYMSDMLILLLAQMVFELILNYTKAVGASKTYAIIGITQTLLLLTLNLLFLKVFSFGIKGYITAYCLSYFIPGIFVSIKSGIIKYAFIKRDTETGTESTTRNEMLKYSIPLIFNTLSWLVIMSSDRYMIRWMIGVESVGIYSIAAKIPTILQTIITIFTTVWEISSNEIYENEKEGLAVFYEKGMKYYSAIGYCGGSFLLLICPYIMRILARGEFYQGWVYAPFLIVSVVFSTAGGINGAIYAAYKNNHGAFVSSVYGAVLNLILNFFGIRYFGIQGATVSTAISRLFISIYRTKDTEKFLIFDRNYSKTILCSALIVIQAVLLITTEKSRLFTQLLMLILICAVNYGVIIEVIKMLISYVRGGIKKRC